ncbi:uncharacterized protein LOC128960728 [Oppia nitens]|uniref:uncharacterized protein LOC128960728 n=1 Tax=Oppia nitens TaxID=1686743 RepID=UPI0023DBD902|nr:uncharacterized protein LOC128960728 [Oppia nitens]
MMMMMTTIMMIMVFTVPVDCVKGQHVFIKSFNGKTFLFECNVSKDTVDKLKQLIADKLGFLVESQRLVFNKKELKEDKVLSDYNIKNNDTIYLFKKT